MKTGAAFDGVAIPELGMTLADMWVAQSSDGQYLLIYCRRRIVAMLGSMGGDVEMFEFADVGRVTVVELMAML